MPEKTTKQQTVAVTVARKRPFPVATIVATGFNLRVDKHLALVNIRFEFSGRPEECVSLDPTIIQENLSVFKTYVARASGDPDDSAMKEDIVVGPGRLANMLHFCHIGPRAETIFGLVCLAEWLEAGRKDTSISRTGVVDSTDVLVVYSTKELQKKLLLETITVLNQRVKQ